MGVQLCLYIFWNGMGEGGNEQKEWPEDPVRIYVLMGSKTAFFHVALNTIPHLTAVAGLFNICDKGVEILPEIV